MHAYLLPICPSPLDPTIPLQQLPASGLRTHWEALVPFLLENKQAWGALVMRISTLFFGVKDGTMKHDLHQDYYLPTS